MSIEVFFDALINNFPIKSNDIIINQILYLANKLKLNNYKTPASYLIIPHDVYTRLIDMDDDSIDTIMEMMDNPEKYDP